MAGRAYVPVGENKDEKKGRNTYNHFTCRTGIIHKPPMKLHHDHQRTFPDGIISHYCQKLFFEYKDGACKTNDADQDPCR